METAPLTHHRLTFPEPGVIDEVLSQTAAAERAGATRKAFVEAAAMRTPKAFGCAIRRLLQLDSP